MKRFHALLRPGSARSATHADRPARSGCSRSMRSKISRVTGTVRSVQPFASRSPRSGGRAGPVGGRSTVRRASRAWAGSSPPHSRRECRWRGQWKFARARAGEWAHGQTDRNALEKSWSARWVFTSRLRGKVPNARGKRMGNSPDQPMSTYARIPRQHCSALVQRGLGPA